MPGTKVVEGRSIGSAPESIGLCATSQMPIKFPRAFARRKSAGNGLEEVENHPEPSFRVIERPDSGGRSIDKGSPFIPLTHARSSSTPTEDMDNIFSGIEKSLPKNRYAL